MIKNDKRFLLRKMNVHLKYIAVISSLSAATLRMEKFRLKNVTRFRDFFDFFILSVQLCSRFIAGVHENMFPSNVYP